MMRNVAIVFIALCFTGALLAGCGGSADVAGEDSCHVSETGERVALENSHLSCDDAQAILYTLGAEVKQPQEVKTPSGTWICINLPSAKAPLELQCRRGKRHFTIEAAS
jgi:hypothetical protein